MLRTENPIPPPLAVFPPADKRSPESAKALSVLAASFDENLLRRLKAIDLPAVSLAWLSRALGVVTATIVDAEAVLAQLKFSAGAEKAVAAYLDDSVKVLDVCNSIFAEIERLRHGRILIRYVLHLLCLSSEGISSKDASRARFSIAEYRSGNEKSGSSCLLKSASLIRDLVHGLADPPKGKISSSERLLRRTIYAVGAVTFFVAGATVAVLDGSPYLELAAPSGEFMWSEALNRLQSAFAGEMRGFCGPAKARTFADEVEELDAGVLSVLDVIDVGSDVNSQKLVDAVNNLARATEEYSDTLDKLSNGVSEVFRTVVSTRSTLLQTIRL